MLIGVALIAIWLGWNVHQVNKRKEVERFINSTINKISYGVPEKPWRRTPFIWRLLGAEPVQSIDLRYRGTFTEEDRASIEAAFPEADIYLPGR